MAEITDTLEQMLGAQAGQIGAQIGADEEQTRTALHAAIPALMAALGQEADEDRGLRQAIEQDHDGSIIDQLPEYLGGTANLSSRTTDGAGILDHVLGDRQEGMAQALSAKSGLDLGSIMKLLPLLAPILMGMLGKKGGSGGSPGGFSLDDLGSILGREREENRSRNPDIGDILDSLGGGSGSSQGGLGGVLDSLLGGRDRS
jgi:hypothetical protein